MPSMEARLKSADADLDGVSSRSDRKSADAIFLSTFNLTPELSRVNSTPLSSDPKEVLTIQPSTSSNPHESLAEPSPLTMAPPKPGPADTLYPSPSGGFVPSPEEGQDWRLKPPPPGRIINRTSDASPSVSSSSLFASSPSLTSHALSPVAETSQRPTSSQNPFNTSSTSTPTRPPSLPSSNETAAKIAHAASNSLSRRSSQASNSIYSPQLRPTSCATSSIHRISTASSLGSALPTSDLSSSADQFNTSATAAESSNRNSVSVQNTHVDSEKSTRPNSTASYQTARIGDTNESAFWIKVRDFAFPADDPRHHGELLPDTLSTAGSEADEQQQHGEEAEDEFYIEGGAEDDEFDGDEGDANVTQGVYKVLYEFDPVSDHELAVQSGEIVHVVGSLDGGWAIAIKDDQEGIKGLVPATYLEWSGPLPE
ncbi:uncharacterized protein MEPE_06670 [Melanopsichium pennsylvanicum]|uniref:SH3 domain-containing protein n=2 Tax=Melanopsichium pennsylvanicum TaxID=63383 RepID=A0AAJ5C8U3_9BASI|nr:putative protein [Melanopsichium pennsylvanicum 4]SNX87959.1 uncharacterized protein MEPE_06670 [Melanopsichium pennsylvanicum]